jgi:hypothetical protein
MGLFIFLRFYTAAYTTTIQTVLMDWTGLCVELIGITILEVGGGFFQRIGWIRAAIGVI